MHKYFKLLLCIVAPLATGAVAGIVTSANINTWYGYLSKPSFNPPNYLFAPVWTTLYVLMGISFFLILQSPKSTLRSNAIRVFVVQWILNFCWSFLFFQFHALGLALVEILCMWLSILAMIYLFSKINKTAGYLQIPYLLWVSFASILNAAIYLLNRI
jgi:tryptophan-rich sensory protein